MQEVDEVADIPDPWERLRRAHELAGQLSSAVTDVSRMRREAIDELTNGPSKARRADVAAALGISPQRVGQLQKSGPRPERSFLGSGNHLRALFGGKREADKETPGPAVSAEDMRGYELLTRAAKDLSFEVSYEVVEPPGFVDLSRDSLVVACGPRLSPMIEQSLRSDPHIDFAKDEHGWHLIDNTAGVTYRSPMDDPNQPRCVDYGYVARLPRMDGKGTYLYSAGIHAPGVTGGLHYVVENLDDLYAQLKTARFSFIVRCEFDEHTREVTASERVTDLYRPTSGSA